MTDDVPDNGRILRNLGMACNYLMSHILHFYHLVALDYVDVNGTGLIPKGFFAPNYDRKFYARGIDPVLQTGGLGQPAYTVNNAPVASELIPLGFLGDLTPYLAGQYVRALKFRRLAQQIGALFTGKMPIASSYTPGCVTTKSYDPAPGGDDAAVVQKMHEIMYGGPAYDPVGDNASADGTGDTYSISSPHPESLLGFIGKPTDFWAWASDMTGPTTGPLGIGFEPTYLPPWANAGLNPGMKNPGVTWTHGGTYLFDVVAAAHVFPEYFWLGSGYGRTLAWGIFEGAAPSMPDKRLITRGRTELGTLPNLHGVSHGAYPGFTTLPARHLDAREFTTRSAYTDPRGDATGRHMWSGKTRAMPLDRTGGGGVTKPAAYTYAKSPRYDSQGNGVAEDFLPYEVGPYARLMANAGTILANKGGPANGTEVGLVASGAVGVYYPGMLQDVDVTVAPPLHASLWGVIGPGPNSPLGIGVFPGWGANLSAHLNFLQSAVGGSPVFYLPAGAIHPLALNPVPGDPFGNDYYGDATLDRIACRALETYHVGMQMMSWFSQLDKNAPSNKTLFFSWGNSTDRKVPKANAKGAGLTEAPRGALGHWIKIGKPRRSKNFRAFRGKVSNYQIITPTTWNINPKDHQGNHGPAEYAILGTPLVDEKEPIEVLRVLHSFDFCCACTVHVFNAKKEKKFEATLEALP